MQNLGAGPAHVITSGIFLAPDFLMSSSLAILDALPSSADFYAHYWNKRPFLVRDAIDDAVMDGLIAPEELAGLSMEETVRARMVSQEDWTCQFGPFTDEDFNNARKSPWSRTVPPRYCHVAARVQFRAPLVDG